MKWRPATTVGGNARMIEWVLIVYTIFGSGADPSSWVVQHETRAFEERIYCESALAAYRIAGEFVGECHAREAVAP